MPEAKETEEPPSRPPTISSSASHPGVPSSREYARCSPSTKFDAGHGGTFSGEPGRRSRPAETSHDSTEPRYPALCPVVFLDVIARFSRVPLPMRLGPSAKTRPSMLWTLGPRVYRRPLGQRVGGSRIGP